ncbi:MAG: hypothetical protein M3389_05910 [Actinomycetota bacterium]|nr:hypothetical protein [Actinomycetota bacterium]
MEPPGLPGTTLFGRPAVWDARVRFSRGFGLPEPLPEILSMAIKVPDAYGAGRDQDLLLTAAGGRPVARHLFSGGRSHLARSYSSVLPFRAGEETVVFGAVPLASPPEAEGDLDELGARVQLGPRGRRDRAVGRDQPHTRRCLRRRGSFAPAGAHPVASAG